MPSLDQLKNLIAGNAILAAAIKDHDIQILFSETPEVSEDRLFAIWRFEVIVLDVSLIDMITQALVRLGAEYERSGTSISAHYTVAITPAQRQAMAAADRAKEQQLQADANDRREALLLQTLEAMQQQINELRDELELVQLVRAKGGPAGPAGKDGSDGRDGKDIDATSTNLSDLADVEAEAPASGLVLTWTGYAWEAKPTQSSHSIAGGGGKGLEHWSESEEGHLIPAQAGQNIGSLESPIKELFATGNTLYLDDKPLHLVDGAIAFDGELLATQSDVGESFPEAPEDGNQYVRQNGQWVISTSASGGISDAPADGNEYVRKDSSWVLLPESGIAEAPINGSFWLRHQGVWVDLVDVLAHYGIHSSGPTPAPVMATGDLDAGDIEAGTAMANDRTTYDGGNLDTGYGQASSSEYLDGGGFSEYLAPISDGGDLSSGGSNAADEATIAGGDLVSGESAAENDLVYDGGDFDTGESNSGAEVYDLSAPETADGGNADDGSGAGEAAAVFDGGDVNDGTGGTFSAFVLDGGVAEP